MHWNHQTSWTNCNAVWPSWCWGGGTYETCCLKQLKQSSITFGESDKRCLVPIKGILKDMKHKTWLWNRKGHFWTFVNPGQREPKSLMVSHWLWCLCRHAFQVGPVCLHVCGFSLIKLSARLPRSQVALVVTALSSRRLLLVVEIVEVVVEIVERVAAEITSWSTVVTALTTELSTWLPRTLQLVLARARLGPTTLPKKYRNENTQKYKHTETQIHTTKKKTWQTLQIELNYVLPQKHKKDKHI